MNTLPFPVATWIGSPKAERLFFSEPKRGPSDFRVFCVFRGDPFFDVWARFFGLTAKTSAFYLAAT